MNDAAALLSGAVAMGHLIAGIFFLRFWTRARDGLFLSFAVAFFLFAANQALTGLFAGDAETDFAFYSLRLIGFVLIIVAILQKNFAAK